VTRANPWAISAEQAAAREDAIFDQFQAEIKSADRRFSTEQRKAAYLDKQYGNRAVKAAIMAALMRRSAPR